MRASTILTQGGTFEQEPTSVAKVTLWHIPNGSDYHNAEVITCYFSDVPQAEEFTKKYDAIPEMACLEVLKKETK